MSLEKVRLGTSGLKISPIILGCMSYGKSSWQGWVLDAEESLPLLEHAWKSGITTWDTADVYSNGESERVIGQAIKQYNIPREELVIMTKCYFGADCDFDKPTTMRGLSRKAIFASVQESMERLGTYIDVLQIHRLDQNVDREEIMRALNDVVEKGWVRYIGASSMATWEFATLQQIAAKNGWHRFISMQNYYNLLYREEEREMIPYCKDTGVGLIPWSPLARGVLARAYSEKSAREQTDIWYDGVKSANEYLQKSDKGIIDAVEQVAKAKGASMANVATAWVLGKGINPIVGLASKKRIDEAVQSVSVKLTEEEVKKVEEAYVSRPTAAFW